MPFAAAQERERSSVTAPALDGRGGRRSLARATQQGLDVSHEHARAIGLGHEVVRAQRHGDHLVRLGRAAREHDDRDGGGDADLPADELAIRARKREIEKGEVRGSGEGELGGAGEVLARLDLEALALEHANELDADAFVVLYDIDFGQRSPKPNAGGPKPAGLPPATSDGSAWCR